MTKIPLRLRLTATDPPTGDFGLQVGKDTLLPGAAGPDGSVVWEIEVTAVHGPPVRLSGPAVHGPSGGKFLYLSLRGADGAWIRRTKVPLGSITAELANTGALMATVDASRAATVPIAEGGWVPSD